MELSERMLKVDTRVFILHLKSLPVADLSTPTWLPSGGCGPCLSRRGPSKYVAKFAVFLNNNNSNNNNNNHNNHHHNNNNNNNDNNNKCLYCSLDKNTYPMLQDIKIKRSAKLQ